MPLAPGTMLNDHLRLREPLGAGAMGSVWVAEDQSLDRLVAVKLVATDLSHNPAAIARFRREASLAAKIKSPHVVEIHGHGVSEDGSPFIVMELLEGTPLSARAERGALPVHEVREIVMQLGRALTAAHALDVVHRDIKPANVFLVDVPGYDVFVKVVDFGIAKQSRAEAGSLTATGAVIGTPWYMSPEQLMSTKDADHRADLWALAVMTYQLLTGRLPFNGETIGAVSIAVAKGEFVAASRIADESLAPFDPWFERAFARDVDARFQSAEALALAFDSASRGLPPAKTAPEARADDEPVDGDSTAAFVGRRQLAIDLEAQAPTLAADASREATPSAPSAAAAASVTTAGGGAVGRAPRRRLWALGGVAALTLVVLGWLRFEQCTFTVAVPSAAAPPSSGAPTASTSSATASSAPVAAPPGTQRWRGRLPTGHIQEVLARHFDALTTCTESNDGPARARVRTLRFVIAEDGSTRDVHVAEIDPTTPRFDACLVSKVAALRFVRPEGGVVTVSYPITFSAESWAPLDDGACELATECLERGRCSAVGDRCTVRDDADCLLARVCTRQGLCRADGGRCVAGSTGGPSTPECQRHGLCAVEGGRARATTDAHCRASTACSRFGLCTARAGVCVVESDESCAKSAECRERGNCLASAEGCAAGSDVDCRQSVDCQTRGLCAHRFPGCAARVDEDCRRSLGCRESGRCTASPLGLCIASSDADCQRSTKCAEADRCVAVDGSCSVRAR